MPVGKIVGDTFFPYNLTVKNGLSIVILLTKPGFISD